MAKEISQVTIKGEAGSNNSLFPDKFLHLHNVPQAFDI